MDVEEPACQHPGGSTLDALDVPLNAVFEGQDVRAIDRQGLVGEPDHVNEHRLVRQEHLTRSGSGHQAKALARRGLLEQAAHPAALVLEMHVALVGDHRAAARHHRRARQLDLHEVLVLDREGLAGLHLAELLKPARRFAHARLLAF